MGSLRRLLIVCAATLVVFTVGSTGMQEGQPVSKILVLPESLQAISLKEYLARTEGSPDPGEKWRPLSEKEITQRKEEMTSRALEYSVELADSLRAPYLSKGLLWTEETFSSYRDLAKRYRLHFKLSNDQAALQYDFNY